MPVDVAPVPTPTPDLKASSVAALVAPAMTQAEAAQQLERTAAAVEKMLFGSNREIKAGVDELLSLCDGRRRAFDLSAPWNGGNQRHPFTRYDLHDRFCANRMMLDKLIELALTDGTEPRIFMSRDMLQEVVNGFMRRQVAGAVPGATAGEKEAGERASKELYGIARRMAAELRPDPEHTTSRLAGYVLFGIHSGEWVLNGREHSRIAGQTGHFVFGEKVVFIQAGLASTAGAELNALMDARQPGKKKADPQVYALINIAGYFGTNAAPMAESLVRVLDKGAPKEALAAATVLPKLGNIGETALAGIWQLKERSDLPAERREIVNGLVAHFGPPVAPAGESLAMASFKRPEGEFSR